MRSSTLTSALCRPRTPPILGVVERNRGVGLCFRGPGLGHNQRRRPADGDAAEDARAYDLGRGLTGDRAPRRTPRSGRSCASAGRPCCHAGRESQASTGPQTALAQPVLAGDWTATGLPATIEGAIRSGRQGRPMRDAGEVEHRMTMSSKEIKKEPRLPLALDDHIDAATAALRAPAETRRPLAFEL